MAFRAANIAKARLNAAQCRLKFSYRVESNADTRKNSIPPLLPICTKMGAWFLPKTKETNRLCS
jgi:hypothetical protein